MKKILKRTLIVLIALGGIIFLAFKLSPYPSVWIIRHAFNKEAIRVNKELENFVPDKIETIRNVQYDETDKEAYMDFYFHKDSVKAKGKLPVIVWTHGGGLISGNKNQLSNYCKILASKGYVAISIDYTIAPEAKYPTPMQQLNRALAYISSNPDKFNADTSFFVLAGDSGGSMISAATANVITSPSYAQITNIKPGLNPNQLKCLLLYCGIYEIDNLKTEGAFGSFLKTVMWAYFGKKDISNDDYAKTASVTNFLTSSFPPTFISAGNNDPLLPQSKILADKLSTLKISIDTLFFPENHEPALGHEYQFTLDDAGKFALERSIKYLKSIAE
ncbi:alpha/beta hydrolase [Flavihumibacter profundi]|uniref:alpha/beta hydrolase n=1 Tax=Flavihumibacter profundi TaxID=2716883 RepID=UPI001CC59A72|nr:alpha/beta hydrolase [Flavihumibacter profundi]MBZ5858138.1 alpha/beta hydrolase [Flavihumibacter profundi]